jgi:hypothetical protein
MNKVEYKKQKNYGALAVKRHLLVAFYFLKINIS